MENIEMMLLRDKVACYEKQISDMKKELDSAKAELVEIRNYAEKMRTDLINRDGTEMFNTLMENSHGKAKELLSKRVYHALCCVEINKEKYKHELPDNPIDVAKMLIESTITIKAGPIQKTLRMNCPDEYESDRYSKNDLKQIAEHLLVYCNGSGRED